METSKWWGAKSEKNKRKAKIAMDILLFKQDLTLVVRSHPKLQYFRFYHLLAAFNE